jgi:hypothetical protein
MSIFRIKKMNHNRYMMKALPLALLPLFGILQIAVAAQEKIAVFNFEMIDTSLEGEMQGKNQGDIDRLAKLAPEVRARLAEANRYNLVDVAPQADAAHQANLQACGGCDAVFARKLGAGLSITGTVQKVSPLILNINIYIRNLRTNQVRAMSVDMRGDTDESWSRAIAHLIRDQLLPALDGE